jgi:maleylpyruvate isomerase
VEVSAADLGELLQAAVRAHQGMWDSVSPMTDGDCRGRSLLPGWTRGHVLTHWARNADGQSRMLLAAIRGEVAEQYPGGDARRASDIEAGAGRPARLVLADARAAVDRVERVWRRMTPEAWLAPTAARAGQRPAWMSVWARWRETEVHHVDLDAGYTHREWPAEFVSLLLERVLPTLAGRVADGASVRAVADGGAQAAECASGDVVVVRGPAAALACWLAGRPAGAAELTVTRGGRPWPLPVLRPWA